MEYHTFMTFAQNSIFERFYHRFAFWGIVLLFYLIKYSLVQFLTVNSSDMQRMTIEFIHFFTLNITMETNNLIKKSFFSNFVSMYCDKLFWLYLTTLIMFGEMNIKDRRKIEMCPYFRNNSAVSKWLDKTSYGFPININ